MPRISENPEDSPLRRPTAAFFVSASAARHSSSQARQLAGVAICGGELIGLYEGCQAVFTPRVCEVNEKNCGSDLYEGKKPCVVLELLPERDVVSVVLAGEIFPSSKGRGYVMRKIVRRLLRYAYLNAITEPFMGDFVPAVIEMMRGRWREL